MKIFSNQNKRENDYLKEDYKELFKIIWNIAKVLQKKEEAMIINDINYL